MGVGITLYLLVDRSSQIVNAVYFVNKWTVTIAAPFMNCIPCMSKRLLRHKSPIYFYNFLAAVALTKAEKEDALRAFVTENFKQR